MPAVAEMSEKKVRTTVTLPKKVYDEARSCVDKNVGPAETIGAFFTAAIVAYLKLLRRKQIDAKFALMAEDSEYQKHAKLISEEFSQSDWEAFESVEKDV